MEKIIINGIKVNVKEGSTILDVCKELNIYIPTLCYHPDQSIKGSCRLCIVEINGTKDLKTACSTKITKGMIIHTESKKVKETRKILLELLLSNHDFNCQKCNKKYNCELKTICEKIGVDETRYTKYNKRYVIDNSNTSIVRDLNKCIKCGRCVEVCKERQGISILGEINRSDNLIIAPYNNTLSNSYCTYCGQCANVCPVGAITVKNDIDIVLQAINDKNKHVIVQVAPSIRVAIGEMFNMDAGSITTGKLVTALKIIGFDEVFDTNFGADLTIVEESSELIDRIIKNKTLPMITSCCPAWINYIEQYYPELLIHVSSCKSPQQMFGAVAKNYYSKKINKSKKDIFVVSLMPCTAKKYEAIREEMFGDVDAVITTVEFANLLKQKEIDFKQLKDTEFDMPLGVSTGAGTIFGNTGGVMEAALRTTYEFLENKQLEKIEFNEVRGLKGIKEATINLKEKDIKVAVAHTLSNAKKILDDIKKGNCEYTFIEVMACPGGCIGGGGQPYTTNDIRQKRINSLYKIDDNFNFRKSHQNEVVQKLYKAFLIEPLSEESHKLLHTTYKDREKK